MNMPGFTAEASLSKSNEHYELIADKTQYSKSSELCHRGESFPADVYMSATGSAAAVELVVMHSPCRMESEMCSRC